MRLISERNAARTGRRRVSWLVILTSLLALGLASCEADSEPGVIDGGNAALPVTITISYAMGDGAHHRGIQTIINDFKKSHLNVQLEVMPDNPQAKGYADHLTILDAMDMFPDLVEMRDTQMFADAGLLAELPEEIGYWFDSTPKVNGKLYTAPLAANMPQGIIYNKKLFRELGLSEPDTYEQFLKLCSRLKQAGVAPIVVGGKDLWHMGFWVNHFLLDYVYSSDQEWNRKRTMGRVSWTDPQPMAAFRELQYLWQQEYVVPGFQNISDSQTVSYLVSGEAAMLMSGPWMFEQLEQADPEFETGFFPVPDRQGRYYILGLPIPSGWAISAKAANDLEKLKYIKQFLHFFYSGEEYPKYLEAVSALSAINRPVDYERSELLQEVEQLLRNPRMIKLHSMDHYWGADQMPPGFRNRFYTILQNCLTGKITVEEAMRQADQVWDG